MELIIELTALVGDSVRLVVALLHAILDLT